MADEISNEELLAAIRKLHSADLPETADEVAERVGESLAAAARRRKRREAEMPKIAPRFEPVVNWGHILTCLTIVSGLVVAYGNFTSKMAIVDQSLDNLNVKIAPLPGEIAANRKANDVQEERIQNLALSVVELRRANAELMTILGNIREDMAQVRAKLSIERRPTP